MINITSDNKKVKNILCFNNHYEKNRIFIVWALG